MLGVELIRNGGGILKAFRLDQNDLQLGRCIDIHDLIAVLLDLLLGVALRRSAALPAGEDFVFGIVHIGFCFGIDTEFTFQTVKHGHGRKTPLKTMHCSRSAHCYSDIH